MENQINQGKHYVTITNFVNDTFETGIYYTTEEQTVDNIVETIMEKYDQFYFNENIQEPKIKSITAYEIIKFHQYDNLDESFKLHKEKFLQEQKRIESEEVIKPKRKYNKKSIKSTSGATSAQKSQK